MIRIAKTKDVMISVWNFVDDQLERNYANPVKDGIPHTVGICEALTMSAYKYCDSIGELTLEEKVYFKDEMMGIFYGWFPTKFGVFQDFYRHDHFCKKDVAIINWWWVKGSSERIRFAKAVIEALKQDLI